MHQILLKIKMRLLCIPFAICNVFLGIFSAFRKRNHSNLLPMCDICHEKSHQFQHLPLSTSGGYWNLGAREKSHKGAQKYRIICDISCLQYKRGIWPLQAIAKRGLYLLAML